MHIHLPPLAQVLLVAYVAFGLGTSWETLVINWVLAPGPLRKAAAIAYFVVVGGLGWWVVLAAQHEVYWLSLKEFERKAKGLRVW